MIDFANQSPMTQHASYAAVLDLRNNDQERCDAAARFQQTGSFQVIALARSSGEQDILRAEIHAVVEVAINIRKGTLPLHVDSQSAISLAELALTAESPKLFAAKDHFDLLLQLWQRRRHVDLTLKKIKAHQVLPEITMLSGIGSLPSRQSRQGGLRQNAAWFGDKLLPPNTIFIKFGRLLLLIGRLTDHGFSHQTQIPVLAAFNLRRRDCQADFSLDAAPEVARDRQGTP